MKPSQNNICPTSFQYPSSNSLPMNYNFNQIETEDISTTTDDSEKNLMRNNNKLKKEDPIDKYFAF